LVLKPPKQGNCIVTDAGVPKSSLADLRFIFHDKTSERFETIVKLKEKLDSLIANNEWEACNILPNVNSGSSIRDCIVCYACGYVTGKTLKHKNAQNV